MTSKKILFATMPMDGHFNPLTGLAVHLRDQGHDVRWYVGGHYGAKVKKLGLIHYPYHEAKVINQENLDEVFPERQRIKGTIARLRFDFNHVFLLRAPEYITDVTAIHKSFPFDLLVCDTMFSAAPMLRHILKVPVATVGIAPLSETSKDLPPAGLGLEPATTIFGRLKHDFLRFLTTRVLFKPCNDLYNEIRQRYQMEPARDFVFDSFIRTPDLYLQSGVPGFEYKRSTMSPNVRFVGPLLPHSSGLRPNFAHAAKLKGYKKVILATQGTVERDPEKILVPTLEAFKDTDYLVVVTTGGSKTGELRARYPQANVLIEDFIDFNLIMPHADVYVTNAGFGGVMLSIQHGLPMVAAGIHEGKSEIAARIGYFKLGVNLRTETPTPDQIRASVETVVTDLAYRRNVARLRTEFAQYDSLALSEQYINELLAKQPRKPKAVEAI